MDSIKKAINTGKMLPKRHILSIVRTGNSGLKKWDGGSIKMGKFFKTAQSGGMAETDTRTKLDKIKEKPKNTLKWVKKNPIKATIAADILLDQVYPTQHGVAWEGTNWLAKKVHGKNAKIPAPNTFDNWFLFGIPATKSIGDATGWW